MFLGLLLSGSVVGVGAALVFLFDSAASRSVVLGGVLYLIPAAWQLAASFGFVGASSLADRSGGASDRLVCGHQHRARPALARLLFAFWGKWALTFLLGALFFILWGHALQAEFFIAAFIAAVLINLTYQAFYLVKLQE